MDEVLANTAAGGRVKEISTRLKNSRAHDYLGVTVVAGAGSPHGDDQVGWRVVELLENQAGPDGRCVKLRDGSDSLPFLEGCRRLIIVDACRSGAKVGSIRHLQWPDPRIDESSCCARHGMSICEALRLADSMGQAPALIEIFAIEVGNCTPGDEPSPAVVRAAREVSVLIAKELSEEAYA